jgi:hypothetical protein
MNIHEAIIFATLKHQNQKRKGTEIPYIVHPMEVMQLLTAEDLPEEIIIAGILHDTLEDTDTKPEEIEQKFGKAVLDIVLTESEDKSKTWHERKQHTIDCLQKDTMATKLVCCADKLSNIKSMYADLKTQGEKLWERFNAPKEDIKWYYESIAEALYELSEYKMYDELCETIKAVFGTEKIESHYRQYEFTVYREKTEKHISDTMIHFDEKEKKLLCSDWSYWKAEYGMSSDDREYYRIFPKESFIPLLNWLKTLEKCKPVPQEKLSPEAKEFLLKVHDKTVNELLPYLITYFEKITDAELMGNNLPNEIKNTVSVWHSSD